MTEIAEILHNIADHTETFHRFLTEPGIQADLKARLIDHIVLEEKDNSAKLQMLHANSPTPLSQKLLDHSFILQRIMGEQDMPLDLKQELLHHFIEEHQEWQKEIIGTASGHTEDGKPYSSTMQRTSPDRNTETQGDRYSHSHGSSHQKQTTGHTTGSTKETEESREWTVGPMWNQGD